MIRMIHRMLKAVTSFGRRFQKTFSVAKGCVKPPAAIWLARDCP